MKPKAGDSVKVTTIDGEYEGTLLPRPELLSDDITVIKLTTGYNVGIETKKIKKIQVLKQYKSVKKVAPKLKPQKGLPTVAILWIFCVHVRLCRSHTPTVGHGSNEYDTHGHAGHCWHAFF